MSLNELENHQTRGDVMGNRSTRTQETRPGQLAPRTQDNSHPTMSQLAPDSMLRAYCLKLNILYNSSPSLTSTPALASTGAREQPGKPRVLVRVRVGQGAS